MQSELGGEDTLVWFSLDDVVLENGENNIRLVGEVYFSINYRKPRFLGIIPSKREGSQSANSSSNINCINERLGIRF